MNLVLTPERFDVIVTTNLFGDILSDRDLRARRRTGLAPGANIGVNGGDLRGGARHGARHRGERDRQPGRSRPRGMPDARSHRRLAHAPSRIRTAFERRPSPGQVADARPWRHATTDRVHRRHHRETELDEHVLHVSDLHFGPPAVPEQYDAIAEMISDRDATTSSPSPEISRNVRGPANSSGARVPARCGKGQSRHLRSRAITM